MMQTEVLSGLPNPTISAILFAAECGNDPYDQLLSLPSASTVTVVLSAHAMNTRRPKLRIGALQERMTTAERTVVIRRPISPNRRMRSRRRVRISNSQP